MALTHNSTDGQVIYTAIFFGFKDSGYLRKDYSESGWEQRAEEDQNPFSFWKSKWKERMKEEDNQSLQKEDAESLLTRLVTEDKPETEPTRYILALMLERAKTIIEEDSQQVSDGILRVYRHKKSNEAYLIKDPQLPLDQIISLQEDVIRTLDGIEKN